MTQIVGSYVEVNSEVKRESRKGVPRFVEGKGNMCVRPFPPGFQYFVDR